MKRAALVAVGGLVGSYLFILVLGGWVFSDCIESRIESRLARALAAAVEASDVSVNMATGKVEIKSLSIKREGVDIAIKSVRVSLPGLGQMIWSRDIARCVVSGVVVELGGRGVVALAKRERVALTAREFHLRDATISVSPTLLFPGLGKVTTRIESATSRNVEFTSAMSWITNLDEMIASAEGPVGASAAINYSTGTLTLAGTWFGSDAIAVPFEIPKLDRSLLEVDQLKAVGKAATKAVAKHLAKDKLFDIASDLFK